LDGLSKVFKALVALDHVATGGSQFNSLGLDFDFTHNSISEAVGELFFAFGGPSGAVCQWLFRRRGG